MAKKIADNKDSLKRYKANVQKKLSALMQIFARASIGDFSKDLIIPSKTDEFTGVYVGTQMMLEVIREKISALEEINLSLETRLRKFSRKKREEIFIGSKGRLVKINVSDILFIKALGDYVLVQTQADRHVIHSTMKKMLSKLPKKEFMRIHHSFIVRLDKIEKKEINYVEVSGMRLPVSRANRTKLSKVIVKNV